MMKILYIYIISLILLAEGSIYGQVNPYSPEARLKFGLHLYQEGDYIRALDEFSFSSRNDTAVYYSGKILQTFGKYDLSGEQFLFIKSGSPYYDLSRFNLYLNAYLSGDSLFLRSNRTEGIFPQKYSENVEKLTRTEMLLNYAVHDNNEEWFAGPFNSDEAVKIREFYNARVNPERKNPVKAALFSTVIPGSGKIYTEDYGDGITAFILTGLFAYLAYDNFDAGHDFRAYLFTGLGAWFYAGNIYGSYSSAQIFNVKYRTDISSRIEDMIKSFNYFNPE